MSRSIVVYQTTLRYSTLQRLTRCSLVYWTGVTRVCVTYFEVDHRRQRGQNARRKLGRIDQELRVDKEHATDEEV